MKKLAILSPLVLLATTALAQDSTCILQPSCSQLGYTSAEADCGSAKVLRCPFDVSQVACLSTGSDSSGGSGGGDDYNPYDPNNELGDVIAVKINMTEAGSATFTYGGGNIIADCGEGTIVGGSAGSSGTISCTYTAAGTYTVKLSGDFTYYGGSSPAATSLIKLDKSGITRMSKVCGSSTNGVVPPLPSTLIDGTEMFSSCSGINSPYPKLPATLEVADNMFYGAEKFTGSVALPETLKSASYMFSGASGLTSITGLENTKITDGTEMFKNAKIAGAIALPATLTDATYMFYGVGAITITGLENTKITDGSDMFSKSGLTSISALPPTLTTSACMFYKTGLTSLPKLPSSLKTAWAMFRECSNLTGTLTKAYFPSSLTNAKSMFSQCSSLKASNISRPSTLSNYGSIFCSAKGITYDSTWEDSPAGCASGYQHSCY